MKAETIETNTRASGGTAETASCLGERVIETESMVNTGRTERRRDDEQKRKEEKVTRDSRQEALCTEATALGCP